MRRSYVAAIAVTGALAVAGCTDTTPTGDAPTGPVDDTPAAVINFPDGYANVAHKCDGQGHRVYSTTRQAPPVIVDDASCGPAR